MEGRCTLERWKGRLFSMPPFRPCMSSEKTGAVHQMSGCSLAFAGSSPKGRPCARCLMLQTEFSPAAGETGVTISVCKLGDSCDPRGNVGHLWSHRS